MPLPSPLTRGARIGAALVIVAALLVQSAMALSIDPPPQYDVFESGNLDQGNAPAADTGFYPYYKFGGLNGPSPAGQCGCLWKCAGAVNPKRTCYALEENCCPVGYQQVNLDMYFDLYPGEFAYELIYLSPRGEVRASGPPTEQGNVSYYKRMKCFTAVDADTAVNVDTGMCETPGFMGFGEFQNPGFYELQHVRDTMCLPPGTFRLQLYDTFGDGLTFTGGASVGPYGETMGYVELSTPDGTSLLSRYDYWGHYGYDYLGNYWGDFPVYRADVEFTICPTGSSCLFGPLNCPLSQCVFDDERAGLCIEEDNIPLCPNSEWRKYPAVVRAFPDGGNCDNELYCADAKRTLVLGNPTPWTHDVDSQSSRAEVTLDLGSAKYVSSITLKQNNEGLQAVILTASVNDPAAYYKHVGVWRKSLSLKDQCGSATDENAIHGSIHACGEGASQTLLGNDNDWQKTSPNWQLQVPPPFTEARYRYWHLVFISASPADFQLNEIIVDSGCGYDRRRGG